MTNGSASEPHRHTGALHGTAPLDHPPHRQDPTPHDPFPHIPHERDTDLGDPPGIDGSTHAPSRATSVPSTLNLGEPAISLPAPAQIPPRNQGPFRRSAGMHHQSQQRRNNGRNGRHRNGGVDHDSNGADPAAVAVAGHLPAAQPEAPPPVPTAPATASRLGHRGTEVHALPLATAAAAGGGNGSGHARRARPASSHSPSSSTTSSSGMPTAPVPPGPGAAQAASPTGANPHEPEPEQEHPLGFPPPPHLRDWSAAAAAPLLIRYLNEHGGEHEAAVVAAAAGMDVDVRSTYTTTGTVGGATADEGLGLRLGSGGAGGDTTEITTESPSQMEVDPVETDVELYGGAVPEHPAAVGVAGPGGGGDGREGGDVEMDVGGSGEGVSTFGQQQAAVSFGGGGLAVGPEAVRPAGSSVQPEVTASDAVAVQQQQLSPSLSDPALPPLTGGPPATEPTGGAQPSSSLPINPYHPGAFGRPTQAADLAAGGGGGGGNSGTEAIGGSAAGAAASDMEPALSLASGISAAGSSYGSAYGQGGMYGIPGRTMYGGMHPGGREAGAGGGEVGYASGSGEEGGGGSGSGGDGAAATAGRRPAQLPFRRISFEVWQSGKPAAGGASGGGPRHRLPVAMEEEEVGEGAGEGCFAVGSPDFEFQLPALACLQSSPSAEPMAALPPVPPAPAAAAVAGSDRGAGGSAFAATPAATEGQAGRRRSARGRSGSGASREDAGAQALAPAGPEEWFPGSISVSSAGGGGAVGGGGGGSVQSAASGDPAAAAAAATGALPGTATGRSQGRRRSSRGPGGSAAAAAGERYGDERTARVARVWRNADLHGGTPTLDSGEEGGHHCSDQDDILPGHDAAMFTDSLLRRQQQHVGSWERGTARQQRRHEEQRGAAGTGTGAEGAAGVKRQLEHHRAGTQTVVARQLPSETAAGAPDTAHATQLAPGALQYGASHQTRVQQQQRQQPRNQRNRPRGGGSPAHTRPPDPTTAASTPSPVGTATNTTATSEDTGSDLLPPPALTHPAAAPATHKGRLGATSSTSPTRSVSPSAPRGSSPALPVHRVRESPPLKARRPTGHPAEPQARALAPGPGPAPPQRRSRLPPRADFQQAIAASEAAAAAAAAEEAAAASAARGGSAAPPPGGRPAAGMPYSPPHPAMEVMVPTAAAPEPPPAPVTAATGPVHPLVRAPPPPAAPAAHAAAPELQVPRPHRPPPPPVPMPLSLAPAVGATLPEGHGHGGVRQPHVGTGAVHGVGSAAAAAPTAGAPLAPKPRPPGILRTGSTASGVSHGVPWIGPTGGLGLGAAGDQHLHPGHHPPQRKSVSFFDDEAYQPPKQLRKVYGRSRRHTYDSSGEESGASSDSSSSSSSSGSEGGGRGGAEAGRAGALSPPAAVQHGVGLTPHGALAGRAASFDVGGAMRRQQQQVRGMPCFAVLERD